VKLTTICTSISLACISMQAVAQQTTTDPAPKELQRVEVTGSSIKRVDKEGSLPVQVISRQELERSGIVTAEQLLQRLTVNGNGTYNLAANSDVAAGSNRGNNGLSAANLRGQGAEATLVLLNGRRVASHGLNGGVVDLNSIPMAAIERIEVLKDGASSLYGADAVGGVINFILRKDFTGASVTASTDITQKGGGNIGRLAVTGGYGNVDTNGFNIMGSLAASKSTLLKGTQRDFVNTYQPDRGLSPDTRGAPFATAFAISSVRNALSSRTTPTGPISNGTGPLDPGKTSRVNGINVLDLPGQAGCASIDGQSPYDELIWDNAPAKYGCAWDTGRAAALQQPLETLNGVLRGTYKVNSDLRLIGEFVAGSTTSKKVFSNNQISSSNSSSSPNYRLLYPSTGSAYNRVFNALVATFPSIEENRGQGIAFRWRCMACGPREIETSSDTKRFLFGAEGSFGAWDYKAGYSQASSDSKSKLAGGYYFNDKFQPLLRSGLLNPFLQAGESQTQAALDALAAASATGTSLYGGKNTVNQLDASISGPISKLAGGDVMLAVGIDRRKEKFSFNGDTTEPAIQQNIFNAPFDSVNTLNGKTRNVTAVYTEVLAPVTKELELTAAIRHDRYSGIGNTTNPKVTFRFVPAQEVLMRGSYNTGFKVPSFRDLFFGLTQSDYSGKDLVDPAKCKDLIVSNKPGCESITPTIVSGGRPDLKPEKAKQWTLGFVVAPTTAFSANVDYWQINRTGAVSDLDIATLVKNSALFPNSFGRDAAGNLVVIDGRAVNAGETATKGLELGARFNTALSGGKLTASVDGTYLLSRKAKLLPGEEFGENEVGKFSRSTDIPLRWKHVASLTYATGPWTGTISQLYSSSYKDNVAPGVANETVTPINFQERVKSYVTHDVSVTYTGVKSLSLTFLIKNLLNTKPPFSAAYDSDTGAGSSWEPRVADPRGRAFSLTGTYTF
jgi:iron complex outermembrane recepter protein